MKNIIKKVGLLFVLGLVFVGTSFANVDSTRATGIGQSDLTYAPFDAGNKCGYDIGFILGFHEGYKREYAMLMPVKYDVDSIIDGVVVSAPGCSDWLNHISTNVCSDSYLKSSFVATSLSGLVNTGTLMQINIDGDYSVDGNKISFNKPVVYRRRSVLQGSGLSLIFKNISSKVSNKEDLSSLNLSGVDTITYFNTGLEITYLSGYSGVKTINFGNPSLYAGLVYPISVSLDTNNNLINVVYGNYYIKGNITYDLDKLYNYSDFRSLWHGLDKIGDQLVVEPIGGTNYVHGQNVVFKDGNISWNPGYIHSTSEYSDNYCKDEFAAGNDWWISSNQHFGVTSYAKSLSQSPIGHTSHVCASTILKITDPYVAGSRIDELDVDSVSVGLDTDGKIIDSTKINSCGSQVNSFQLPIDADIDLSNMGMSIGDETSKVENVGTTKLIKNYTVDSNKVCFYNIKVNKLPRNQNGGANSMSYTKVNLTDVELVIRSSDGRTNIADTGKIPYSITEDGTVIPKLCFDVNLQNGYTFTKPNTFGLLLKFWAGDTIRGDTPIMILKTIPNNDYKINNVGLIESVKPYADGYSVFTGEFEVTDSFGNVVSGYNLQLLGNLSIKKSSFYVDEISKILGAVKIDKLSYDNGRYIVTFVLFNNKPLANPLQINVPINKRDLDGNLTSDKINVAFDSNISNALSVFSGFSLLTGANSVIGFGLDFPIKLLVSTANYNNINPLKDVKIHTSLYVAVKDCNTPDKNVSVVASSGYTDLFNKLEGLGYDWVPDFNKNSSHSLDLKIRIENENGATSSNYILCGTGWIQYYINGINGYSEQIKKSIDWKSNLDVHYWGVYVEGLYSTKASGIYELLRNSKTSNGMATSTQNIANLKLKFYNNIIKKVTQVTSSVSDNTEEVSGNIDGVYYNNGDIKVDGGDILSKSLIYADGGNVYINGNIKKSSNSSILTIVARSNNGKGGYVFIDPSVTNVDAIIVSEKGIYSTIVDKDGKVDIGKMLDIVKGNEDASLKNQLLIYGLVLSRGNTIGGSIKINNNYVLPGGKKLVGTTANFYRAAIYDINYLRRYNAQFNKGTSSCNISDDNYDTGCVKLKENKYGTYPVIIEYDPMIKSVTPYGF